MKFKFISQEILENDMKLQKSFFYVLMTILFISINIFISDANVYLKPEEIKQLKSSPVKAIIPYYLPNGFNVSFIKVEILSGEEKSYSGYDITYENKSESSFCIRGAGSLGNGWDSCIEKNNKTLVKTKVGNVYICSSENSYYTNWIQYKNKNYELSSPCKDDPSNKRINKNDFIKVIKSLGTIK